VQIKLKENIYYENSTRTTGVEKVFLREESSFNKYDSLVDDNITNTNLLNKSKKVKEKSCFKNTILKKTIPDYKNNNWNIFHHYKKNQKFRKWNLFDNG